MANWFSKKLNTADEHSLTDMNVDVGMTLVFRHAFRSSSEMFHGSSLQFCISKNILCAMKELKEKKGIVLLTVETITWM